MPSRSARPATASAVNLTVILGVLTRAAELRQLPSGDHVVAYEVAVRPEDGPVDTVPVVWHGAPPAAGALGTGTEVVVVGRVRRRFFRAGGSTQSRTEVVAEHVVPARQRRRAQRLVAEAVAVLGEGGAGLLGVLPAARCVRVGPGSQG